MALPRRVTRAAFITLAVGSSVAAPELERSSDAATAATRGADAWAPTVLAVDAVGTFAVVGVDLSQGPLQSRLFIEKRDARGVPIWAKTFPAIDSAPESVTVDFAGDVVVTGRYRGMIDFGGAKFTTSPDEPRAFAVRLGPGGALQFSASTAAARAMPTLTASAWSSLRFNTASSPVKRM